MDDNFWCVKCENAAILLLLFSQCGNFLLPFFRSSPYRKTTTRCQQLALTRVRQEVCVVHCMCGRVGHVLMSHDQKAGKTEDFGQKCFF